MTTPPTKVAIARACANIALVKYWGKRDAKLNLPAAGSLSLTLAALETVTEVSFGHDLPHDRDRFWLAEADGDEREVDDAAAARVFRWLDIVRHQAGIADTFAHVRSRNNFPTASGLASSASAFAALALAATTAAGLSTTANELSILARRGSGSAARSIHSGLVLMHGGDRDDGLDCFAEPIDCDLKAWPLRMIVCVVGGGVAKKHSSRDAMAHCQATSPLYSAWVDSVAPDLASARRAIESRDLEALGAVCEASALAMHASAIAARPAISYFAPPTIALMENVRELRAAGLPAFFTMDAGPHVKVLTLETHAAAVAAHLATVDGVTQVITSAPGLAASITTSVAS